MPTPYHVSSVSYHASIAVAAAQSGHWRTAWKSVCLAQRLAVDWQVDQYKADIVAMKNAIASRDMSSPSLRYI